ncbi:MAG: superoxide dismutase family protein [Proteobacteria bacterium]|nr:superoxide dismutase family protein [Pseudomonadota bacterium]
MLLGVILFGQQAFAEGADKKVVTIHLLNNNAATKGIGEKIGEITFSDSAQGLKIKTDLKGLSPGEHGFHIHEHPSCNASEKDSKLEAGLAAGGHYDPEHSNHHLGPDGKGHLGDLSVLKVDKDGQAKETLYAKRLKLAELSGRSIMIHEGGDNYSDVPPMGGGGARIACGVIEK